MYDELMKEKENEKYKYLHSYKYLQSHIYIAPIIKFKKTNKQKINQMFKFYLILIIVILNELILVQVH